MPLFYDLCWAWQDSGVQSQRERTVMAIRLGIDLYVPSHDVAGALTDRDRCSLPPLNIPALQAGKTGFQAALHMQHGLPWKHGSTTDIQQLTRLTLATEDSTAAAQAFTGVQTAAATYDLVAIRPLSDRVMQQACTSLDVDIITLDLGTRLPFKLKPALLQAAIKRGIHFEICYAPALREETARRNLFTNALALTRATRGKGIIVSSGARSAFELRGPYDVINMASLFGLSEQDAKAAITTSCEAVIAHAQSRKAFKGAILIQPIDTISQQTASQIQANTEQNTSQQQQGSQISVHAQRGTNNPGEHVISAASARQGQTKGRGRKRKTR